MQAFFSLFFVVWIWQSCSTADQHNPKLVPVGFLPKELKENSGLIEIAKDVYVGTNDSGHPAELYVFSLNQKAGSRKIGIEGATNQDWEELTLDDQFVYIGDTGNNDGNRRDLCIYKVRRADLINLNMVHAEKIAFTYPGQTSFTSSSKNNFDCESMVCLGDSLYLFSKNRGNEKTDLYSLPKTPGTYQAIHRGQFNADGLVTGACIRNQGNQSQLVLIGYKNRNYKYSGFMFYWPQVTGSGFFTTDVFKVDFDTPLQIESVIFHDPESVYISNEGDHGSKGQIFQAALPH